MFELDKENFEQEVTEYTGLVLVDYWSPKCEPCLALMPDIEKLAEKYGEKIKFTKLNTAGNRRLAISQKILGLPAIVLYKDGEKVWTLSSDVTIEDIENNIKTTLAG